MFYSILLPLPSAAFQGFVLQHLYSSRTNEFLCPMGLYPLSHICSLWFQWAWSRVLPLGHPVQTRQGRGRDVFQLQGCRLVQQHGLTSQEHTATRKHNFWLFHLLYPGHTFHKSSISDPSCLSPTHPSPYNWVILNIFKHEKQPDQPAQLQKPLFL